MANGNGIRSGIIMAAIATICVIAVIHFTASLPFSHLIEEHVATKHRIPETQEIIDQPPVPDKSNFFNANKIALIIETHPHKLLIPLLSHFLGVLGPSWPIVVFTNEPWDPASAPLQKAVSEKRLFFRTIPEGINLKSRDDLSFFLTDTWLWEQLAPADHVLLFQSDSILCSQAPQVVDDFLEYDFIGAPIDPRFGAGFNGGFSLRNRNLMLKIAYENSFKNEFSSLAPLLRFEDQWFYKKLSELPALADGKPGANLPSMETSKMFAVETIWYERTLAYHQPERYLQEHLKEKQDWCPEMNLASVSR